MPLYMKRELRLQFFKIVEAKHTLATQQVEQGYDVLTEQELFQAIKNIPGVRMIPGSYRYQIPTGSRDVLQPWGPEVHFQFQYLIQSQHNWMTEDNQKDQNIINQIENAITAKYGNIVKSVSVEYNQNNIYDVEITQQLPN